MSYAKITANNEVLAYPINPNTDFPDVSFNLGSERIEYGNTMYVLVQETTPPVPPLGHEAFSTGPVLQSNTWVKGWDTRLLPKDKLKEALQAYRYGRETGGIFIGQHIYDTTRESQIKYTAIMAYISQLSGNALASFSVDWQTGDNTFVKLNAQDMTVVSQAVMQHIQACFSKQAEYYALIDTANNAVLSTTDFTQGWPT